MSGHTAAPWAWQMFGDGWKLIGQHGLRPFVLGCWGVRKSPGPPPPARFVVRDAKTDRMIEFDPNHPDAHLIAAAPELYEALKALRLACVESYKVGRIEAEPFLRAGNVLNKAEGR